MVVALILHRKEKTRNQRVIQSRHVTTEDKQSALKRGMNLPFSSRQCLLKAQKPKPLRAHSYNPSQKAALQSQLVRQPAWLKSSPKLAKSKQQHTKKTWPFIQVSRCCKWMIHQKGWCYVPNATRSAVLVLENVCSHHVARLPHVVLQILPLRLIGQIADEDPSTLYIFTIRISLLDNSS